MVEQTTKPALRGKGARKNQSNEMVDQITQLISQSEAKAAEKIDTTLMQKVDFSAIDEHDPQTEEGYSEQFKKVVKVIMELDQDSFD